MIARRIVSAVSGGFVLLLQACGAGWHRTDLVTPDSPRQQVEVWRGGAALRWHAVRITDSTMSGIPYIRPIDCDSCRQMVPRSTVDSLRLGNPVAGFWKTVGLVVGIPALLLAILWGSNCCPDGI